MGPIERLSQAVQSELGRTVCKVAHPFRMERADWKALTSRLRGRMIWPPCFS